MNRIKLAIILVGASLTLPSAALGQGVVNEAMSSFPAKTIHVEYSSTAKLRKLPNYQNLRQKYVGPRLQTLEGSLAQLGIREDDIDELFLGWKVSSSQMDLYGLASGRFDTKGVAERAGQNGVAAWKIAGQEVYCLQGGTCVATLSDSLGAFGTRSSLSTLLQTRAGQSPALSTDETITRLIASAKQDAPIWGVAVGAAVGDWFHGWMPSQGNLKLDWSRVFEKVETLTYNVEASDKVNLGLRMDCTTQQDAATLMQVLQGLKLAQQMAWQAQNPNRPNPFEAMDVGLDNKQISLQVTTSYDDLELASGVGATQN